jgi:hypothetical protein
MAGVHARDGGIASDNTTQPLKKETLMLKRLSLFTLVFTLTCVAAWAQQNRFAGTWKLNLAKSKYKTGQQPKSQTRTVEPQGDGAKVTFEGVAADGSRMSYSYTTNYDGKDSQVSGVGQPNGDRKSVV